ncbi:S9 family peptidase [Marinimicrobium sp. ABcell2]|uniref:alpha/beta hydrolase family protein n=1 Tax=Marinimicrobium sp. ABcell2 TaxID=3069751 RepID=UPI0027B0E0FD|nr:prolyl oligopeptidase family serine peptidase [Marinimicrobium sp. ABcell2]MDQ2077052.1 prolyl oligopeptidase family serine peptidase [Marinimicrobium sp. ABcell2]
MARSQLIIEEDPMNWYQSWSSVSGHFPASHRVSDLKPVLYRWPAIYRLFAVISGLILIVFSISTHAKPAIDNGYFFGYPGMVNARLSPDGEKVAAIRMDTGSPIVVLIDVDTMTERALFSTEDYSGSGSSISAVAWIDNRHLALQLYESIEGIENLLDTRISTRLVILNVQEALQTNTYRSVRTKGYLVDPLPHIEGEFLYGTSGIYSRVYRLNASKLSPDNKVLGKLDSVDGGQFVLSNEVRSVEGYAFRWFIDSNSVVQAALLVGSEKKVELTDFSDDDKGEVIKTWDFPIERKYDQSHSNRNLIPIAKANDKHSYYCLDANEMDQQSVYKVNFKTGEEQLVYETAAYKVLSLLLDKDHRMTGLRVLKNGAVGFEYIDDGSSQLEDRSPEILTSIIDTSREANRTLIYRESHNIPGEFLVIDDKTGTSGRVGGFFPDESVTRSSRMIEGQTKVNGLDIPYLLNMPSALDEAFPLIVMPHGGPIGVFDNRYYDATTQYLVANGFAVLRVNFRGSGGISRSHREAGVGHWYGKILNDIHQTTMEVSARSDIDPKRICLTGFSYGAYASAMLLIQHPEVYQCAAVVAGVFDLNLLINSQQLAESRRSWLEGVIGINRNNTDALKKASPVYLAGQLSKPIFIVHGSEDRVADVEHSYRFRRMLEKMKKPHEWHIAEGTGHHLSDPEQAGDIFGAIIKFVKENTAESL